MRRPMAVLVVFAVEVGLLFQYQAEVTAFAKTVNALDFFKGLGTLLFPAPIAFLLWYWRDADKQRELYNDAIRLQNENDKLVLEKRILEGEATVAKEKVDKANLETQLAKVQAELASERGKSAAHRSMISGVVATRPKLSDDDISAVLSFLRTHFEDGKLRTDSDALPLSIKALFLTQVGQSVLKDWCEQNPILAPELWDVFADSELPDFKFPGIASK